MEKGLKLELVPLVREDRSDKEEFYDDAQYNGLLPRLTCVVFYDNGYGSLSAVFFLNERSAFDWAQEMMLCRMKGEKI